MKQLASLLIVGALYAAPAVLAQGNSSTNQPWVRPVRTNVTVSGVLNVETGTVVTLPGSNRKVIEMAATNKGEQIVTYRMVTTDGSKVSFGSKVAATSPYNLSAYLNESITVDGIGSVRDGKSGKLIAIEKITTVTRNAAGSQP